MDVKRLWLLSVCSIIVMPGFITACSFDSAPDESSGSAEFSKQE